jgi:hypothetical protein
MGPLERVQAPALPLVELVFTDGPLHGRRVSADVTATPGELLSLCYEKVHVYTSAVRWKQKARQVAMLYDGVAPDPSGQP